MLMSTMASTQLVGTALSWMLTYLIHSTILILAVWLLVRGIKPIAARISPSAENLGWKLALVGAFVTATVQIAVGVRPALGALEVETAAKVVERAPVEQVRPLGNVPTRGPVIVDESTVMMLGITPPTFTATKSAKPEPEPVWPKVLLFAWGLGALLVSVRLGVSALGLRKRLRDRGPVLEDPVLEAFLTLLRDAGISRPIKLTQSSKLASPVALWRREIVLSERAVEELSPAAMRSVLAHEVAHVERRDPVWLAIAAGIEALCFFQPLNRLARRGMQESAELLCDDWAIARTGDGVTFAKSLAEVATWEDVNRSSVLVAGMISGERPLVRRVKRALDGDPLRFDSQDGLRPTRALAGIGGLAALILVAPGVVDASPPSGSEAPSKSLQSSEQYASLSRAEQARLAADEARKRADEAEAEAQRLAAEARAAARAATPQPVPGAGSGSHLLLRDGDEYMRVDENGVELRSDDIDIDISNGQNPRMRVRMHDGDQELDLDVDLDAIANMAIGMLGQEMFGGMPPMPGQPGQPGQGAQPGQPGGSPIMGPGFDMRELERLGQALEGFGGMDEEALDREFEAIERELQEHLLRELGNAFSEEFGGGFDGFDDFDAPPTPTPTQPLTPTFPAQPQPADPGTSMI